MKRILIFSLAYYPSHVSGAEVAIKEITSRIEPGDIEFTMVTHRFARTASRVERIGNVEVHRVGFGPAYISKILFIPLAAWKGAALSRAHRFDASWVMMTYMLFPLVLAKVLGLRGPYALTLQDGDPYEKVFGRWFIKPALPLLNWGFRNATRVQAISTYLASWPKKRGYRLEVEMIPNGASEESAREYPQAELDALARAINKQEGEVLLLSIGRLVRQKNIDTVLRGLALLPAHVRLVVVGEGPDKVMLQALAQELGVSSRVTFAGQVMREETAKYRRVCDIFVLPSRSEGQGISFLSSMLAGLPVVATQEGGIADFLFDAKRNPGKEPTGWAVDAESPAQIAEAVQDIIANPEQTKKVVETAKHMVEQKYNWDTVAKAMRTKVFEIVVRK